MFLITCDKRDALERDYDPAQKRLEKRAVGSLQNGRLAMHTAAARRGLLKLMLRLPAIRDQLQMLAEQDLYLLTLCEVFDDASDALDRLRKDSSRGNEDIILEYGKICSDIEGDVINLCTNQIDR